MDNPIFVQENETHKIVIQTDPLITARWADLVIVSKNKTCLIVEFAVSADHGVKLKQREKRYMYRDLARELKKMWNIKAIMLAVVIGGHILVTKGLVQSLEDLEIRERVDTINNITLLRLAKY